MGPFRNSQQSLSKTVATNAASSTQLPHDTFCSPRRAVLWPFEIEMARKHQQGPRELPAIAARTLQKQNLLSCVEQLWFSVPCSNALVPLCPYPSNDKSTRASLAIVRHRLKPVTSLLRGHPPSPMVPSPSKMLSPTMLSISDFISKTPTPDALTSFYTILHARASSTDSLFLSLTPLPTLLATLRTLYSSDPDRHLPLHAVPYVLKDNIDLPPHPTTAACSAFSYVPTAPAFVVDLLTAAGAVCIGKVNMDQFASGLVGTRSPYGVPTNPWDARYIPGGSSSGSAVAVAAGLAVFALGTDTAGSGRVPAAMNGVVGVKPSKGLLSTTRVVPAAKSLDCVAIIASTVADAAEVLRVTAEWDENNVFSRLPPEHLSVLRAENRLPVPKRFKFGVLSHGDLTFDQDEFSEKSFSAAVELLEHMGGTAVSVDFAPFRDAAVLLYGGPFVAERFAGVGRFIKETRPKRPKDFDPIVAKIITDSEEIPAWKLFDAQERMREFVQKAKSDAWSRVDVLLLPTIPRPVTVKEVWEDPVDLNSMLGTYTNFVNLMDYCAVAVPSPAVDGTQVPRGVTFIAQAFQENLLLALTEKYHDLVKHSVKP